MKSKKRTLFLFWAKILQVELFLVFLLVIGVVAARASTLTGAHASETPPCYDIYFKSDSGSGAKLPALAVLQGTPGVANSGLMQFDVTASVPGPSPTNEACVRMASYKISPDHLEGWVWNSNLGWVSLFCADSDLATPGVQGKNLGVDCGSVEYKVNVVTSGGTAPDYTAAKLTGYAWGDNVGWISFSCNDGTLTKGGSGPAYNNCSTINYGVQLVPTAGDDRGLVDTSAAAKHFAWTDSVGWMDFSNLIFPWGVGKPDDHCAGYVKVAISGGVLDPSCETPPSCPFGKIKDPSSPTTCCDPDPADPTGKTCKAGGPKSCPTGETFDVVKGKCCSATSCLPICPPGDTSAECTSGVCTGPDCSTTCEPGKSCITFDPPSDDLEFKCDPMAMDAAIGAKKYAVCVLPVWKDTVRFDQTAMAADGSGPKLEDHSVESYPKAGVPVSKPVNNENWLAHTDPVTGKVDYEHAVDSAAPTSAGNLSTRVDGTTFQNAGFIYTNDARDKYKYQNNLDTLTLQQLKVMIFKYADGGASADCVYGNVVKVGGKDTCAPKDYIELPVPFNFTPKFGVKDVYQDLGSKKQDFIDLTVSGVMNLVYTIFKDSGLSVSPDLHMYLGFEQEEEDNKPGSVTSFPLKLTQPDPADPTKTIDVVTYSATPGNPFYTLPLDTSVTTSQTFSASVVNKSGSPLPSYYDPRTYIYSVVEYAVGADTLKYFSGKLPTKALGLVRNPVAKVVGNVYGTALGEKNSEVQVRSLGSLSSNIFRENILRGVQKVITGAQNVIYGDVTVADCVNIYDPSGIPLSETVTGSNVYDVRKGDLIITCNDNSLSGKKTFIVENGNVYINGNIYSGHASDDKFGIVVLRDLKKDDGGKTGNIYVAPNVTDIQANMYADGRFYSYAGLDGSINRSNGEPMWADDYARQSVLKNQLRVNGSLSAGVSIGGANALKGTDFAPVDGDGLNVAVDGLGHYANEGGPATGLSRAKDQDLNFLRYYGFTFMVCDDGENIVDQQVLTSPGGDKVKACDPAYAGPPARQIDAKKFADGGDLVPPLTGDGVPSVAFSSSGTTDENFYPVYFEYDPPTGLPGFEGQKEVQ